MTSNGLSGRQSASTSLGVFRQYIFRQPDGTLVVSGAVSRECYENWLKIKRSSDSEAEATKFYRALTNHVAGTVRALSATLAPLTPHFVGRQEPV